MCVYAQSLLRHFFSPAATCILITLRIVDALPVSKCYLHKWPSNTRADSYRNALELSEAMLTVVAHLLVSSFLSFAIPALFALHLFGCTRFIMCLVVKMDESHDFSRNFLSMTVFTPGLTNI